MTEGNLSEASIFSFFYLNLKIIIFWLKGLFFMDGEILVHIQKWLNKESVIRRFINSEDEMILVSKSFQDFVYCIIHKKNFLFFNINILNKFYDSKF